MVRCTLSRPTRWLVALVLAAGPAAVTAQDASDYVLLGRFHQWELVDGADSLVMRVTQRKVVNGYDRFTVSVPASIGTAAMILGYQADALYLYGFKGDVDGIKITVPIKPPALLGRDAMTFGVDQFITNVNTTFTVKVDLGFFSKKIDVDVTGTITAGWNTNADVVTPYGTFPTGRLNIAADLHFSASEFGYDVEEDASESFDMYFGEGVGFVTLPVLSSNYLLNKAILDGSTIGDFPPNEDLDGFSFPVDGQFLAPGGQLITVHGAAASASTGGDYLLTGVSLTQNLRGRVILNASVAPAGAPGEAVAVQLKGRCGVSRKTGLARLRMKGKASLASLTRPLILRVKADLDGSATSVNVTYASFGIAPGSTSLALSPVTAGTATMALTGVVDTRLNPGNPRRMQSNATLTVGTVVFPVTLLEKVKTRADGLKKRSYSFRPDGLPHRVMRIRASSTGVSDYVLDKFGGRILGLRVRFLDPDNEVSYTVQP